MPVPVPQVRSYMPVPVPQVRSYMPVPVPQVHSYMPVPVPQVRSYMPVPVPQVRSYMPVLVSLAQSPSLEVVNLSSDAVTVRDAALRLACTALRHNRALKKVTLNNWRFQIQVQGVRIRREGYERWENCLCIRPIVLQLTSHGGILHCVLGEFSAMRVL